MGRGKSATPAVGWIVLQCERSMAKPVLLTCARATGQLAQTDALAARALAHCADVIRPLPRPRPDTQTQALRALVGRRQPRIGRRTAEHHRLAGTSARLTKAIVAPMTGLNGAIATLDTDLETTRRASPLW